MTTPNEELCPDVPDSELREQLAACREDWQRVCDALGAKGEHMDPDVVVRVIAALARQEAGPNDDDAEGFDAVLRHGFFIQEVDFGDEGKGYFVRMRDFNTIAARLDECLARKEEGREAVDEAAMTPFDRCEFALRDAGFDYDEAFRIAHLAYYTHPAPQAEGRVGEMTPERACYFLRRFKADEKMLGPNEQWALDFAIERCTPTPQSAGVSEAVVERGAEAAYRTHHAGADNYSELPAQTQWHWQLVARKVIEAVGIRAPAAADEGV